MPSLWYIADSYLVLLRKLGIKLLYELHLPPEMFNYRFNLYLTMLYKYKLSHIMLLPYDSVCFFKRSKEIFHLVTNDLF